MFLRYISLAISLIAVCFSGSAYALTIHYVASNGTDTSFCGRTTPCATLFQAHLNAAPNDTIVCLDVVATVAVLINKSIDIECSGGRAILRDGAVNGASIYINIAVSANDPLRTVRLRGISIIGAASTSKAITRGIDIVSAAVVSIEGVVISDMAQQGIFDQRTGGQTRLFITDSIIRNSGGPGIVAAAAAPGIVVLDNVRMENNGFGIAVASGNNVVINRSVLSGNTNAGVIGDPGAQIVVNNSTISHNNVGVYSNQSVRLSNNDIAFNTTSVSGPSGTFGNNRFSGNGTIGTPPSALGGASSDLGQQ